MWAEPAELSPALSSAPHSAFGCSGGAGESVHVASGSQRLPGMEGWPRPPAAGIRRCAACARARRRRGVGPQPPRSLRSSRSKTELSATAASQALPRFPGAFRLPRGDQRGRETKPKRPELAARPLLAPGRRKAKCVCAERIAPRCRDPPRGVAWLSGRKTRLPVPTPASLSP